MPVCSHLGRGRFQSAYNRVPYIHACAMFDNLISRSQDSPGW